MPQAPKNTHEFTSLVEVVRALRGPNGCPWDKEQTHHSLAPYALEETHEMIEAIESNQMEALKEELGDCLFQVVLHSELARQDGQFDINDVIKVISEKMIRRHPHVFADTKVKNSEDVWKNWTKIKQGEKKAPKDSSPFDFPASLPALQRAHKIGVKSRAYNFDWTKVTDVLKKVDEELAEVKETIDLDLPLKDKQHEIGDLLFSVAQLARHLDLDGEQCLRVGNKRFETRFLALLKIVAQDHGIPMQELSAEQLEEAWKKVKSLESK